MRVVLDGVFNHTGRGFWPFHHILETGAASPYRDWFLLDDERLDGGRPLLAYPPPGTPRSALGYEAWWGLPALPKLNTANPEVREYLLGVAEHWLRFGIDGWRLDVPEEIDDEAFWQEFRARCRAIRPDAYLVGEIWRVAPDGCAATGSTPLMNYPLGEAILGFAGGSLLDMDVVRRHHSVRPEPATAGRPGVRRPGHGARGGLRPGRRRRPAQPRRLARRAAAADRAGRRRRRASGWRRSSRRRSRARRASTTATRSGCAAGNDPENRGAFPWDEGRWETGLRDSVRALTAPARDRAGPARRAAAGRRRRRDPRSPSSAARARRASSSRSTRATRPSSSTLRFGDAPDGAGGHLAPVELAGFAAHRRRRRSSTAGATIASRPAVRWRAPGRLRRVRAGVFGHTPRSCG